MASSNSRGRSMLGAWAAFGIDARRETIADAAHVPSMERPREFEELVLGFLEEVA